MREALKTLEWKALEHWEEAVLTLLHKPGQAQEHTPCSDPKVASGEHEQAGAQWAEQANSVWWGRACVRLHRKGTFTHQTRDHLSWWSPHPWKKRRKVSTWWLAVSSALMRKDVGTQMKHPGKHVIVQHTGSPRAWCWHGAVVETRTVWPGG